MNRCPWARAEIMINYHDREWGVPVHDDRLQFEFFILEGAQAGLSWEIVLKKRAAYRKAFDGFRAEKIAKYSDSKIKLLLEDAGIIRNKLKINAAIQNARVFIDTKKEFGSFNDYLWKFVGGNPTINRWKSIQEIPARTRQSDAMSKDLIKRGFKFAGSIICYSHMQATGMVNDHLVDCFRHAQLNGSQKSR